MDFSIFLLQLGAGELAHFGLFLGDRTNPPEPLVGPAHPWQQARLAETCV